MMKQDATTVHIPGEFNDDEDFWPHPVCKKYESNRLGIVRNIKTKNHVGNIERNGYIRFTCNSDCCRGEKKSKKHSNHRFVWESFFGFIEDGKIIDHIYNDKTDNKLSNLQMISQSENLKKGLPKKHDVKPQKIRAINVDSGEIFIYRSQRGAEKDLCLTRSSVSKVLSGMTKTTLSKKLNQSFTFQKIEHDTERLPLIIINNKKNININHVRKMNLNNN